MAVIEHVLLSILTGTAKVRATRIVIWSSRASGVFVISMPPPTPFAAALSGTAQIIAVEG
jgi:hypothetical protein